MQPIILASKSPRRKQLLEWAEIPFEVVTQNTKEQFPMDLPVEKVPGYIAKQKALAVFEKFQDRIILAADTIVTIDDMIIGKPKNELEAIATLRRLSGRTHQVITGVTILGREKEIQFSDKTKVSFYPLTESQIRFYIKKYRPYDKAGAYAIQEWIGVIGIKKIDGDFYNVMGLPVSRVCQALQRV